MALPAWMQKKVGPFPVGAWLLIGVGGIAIAYYVKKRAGGDVLGGFSSSEDAFDMYGVPIESPDEGYGDVPATPPPGPDDYVGGGYYPIPGLPYYPEPGELIDDPTTPGLPAPPGTTGPAPCTKPHQRPSFGGNRACPQGWHLVNPGQPCSGWCVPNAA